jgi:pimeloyl-ACP methyl ester carboxylesterase
LIAAAAWVKTVSEVYKLNIGLFGASTGGAAALLAASQRPDLFRAIVSRGGRPDLAAEALESVKTPTLLIVGELDSQVLLLNQYALRLLTSEKKLEIVRGATHLFEEPGKLEVVASHAAEWFDEYL